MAADEDKGSDFYAVLGLKKECSPAELKIAYKRLALKWHPDRCSSAGNSKRVEEAKKKFQEIQEAYSVLSDSNKRFLYDVGVYDCDDDDDENGMGDFLNEMAAMMNQNKSNENGEESFEELQELFEEMFQSDLDAFVSSSSSSGSATPSSCSSSSFASGSETHNHNNNTISSNSKRNSSEMCSSNAKSGNSQLFEGFCMGAEHPEYTTGKVNRRITGARTGRAETGTGMRGKDGNSMSKRRDGQKQKVSFGHDVSSNDYFFMMN